MFKLLVHTSDTRLAALLAAFLSLGVLVLFFPVMAVSNLRLSLQSERQSMEKEVLRAQNIFRSEIDKVDLSLSDWAAWDETYQFARGQNPTYVERNLNESYIANLGIDVFLAFDRDGRVMIARSIGDNEDEVPLPFHPEVLLTAYPLVTDFTGGVRGHKGLVVMDGQSLLLASRPILDSRLQGPSQGTLVFLRRLGQLDLAALSKAMMSEIDIYPIELHPQDLPDPGGVPDEVVTKVIDTQTVTGFKLLEDLNGAPAAVLLIKTAPVLIQQGYQTGMLFSGMFVVFAALLFVIAFFSIKAFLTVRKAGRRYLERYQAVIQRSSEAILVVQPDWTILEINPSGRRLLASANDRREALNLRDLLQLAPEYDVQFLALASRDAAPIEFCCARHDGQLLNLEMVISQIVEVGETPTYSLNLHDITPRKVTERALRDSESRYRLLFENNPLPMWIYDPKTLAFLEVNDTALVKYGYSRGEFLSMTVADIRPAEDVPHFLQTVTGSRPTYQQTSGWRHILKDGTIIDVDVTSHLLEQPEGRNVLVVAQDVTNRRRMEQEVRSAKELFSKIFHLSPIPTALFRLPDLVFVDLNRTLEESIGYSRTEMLGQPVTDFDLFTNPAQLERFLPLLAEKGRVVDYEFEFISKTGERRQAIGYSEVFELAGEQFFIASILDVTEQKATERALHDSEVRFRALIENAPDGILLLNDADQIIYASPSTKQIIGYTSADILGLGPGAYVHPDDIAILDAIFTELKRDPEKIVTGQYRALNKVGVYRWLEVRVSNLLAEPSVGALVFNYLDITERKATQDALRESQALLERAQAIAHLGSWDLELVNNRLTWSDEVYRIFGLPPGAFEATYEAFLDRVHPEDRVTVDAVYAASLLNASPYETEHRVVRASDGEVRYIHEKGEHICDASGTIVRSVGTVHDITDRQLAVLALKEKTDELEVLFSISTRLRQAQTVSEILPMVLDAICGMLHVEASAIHLLDPLTQTFRIILANGPLSASTGHRFGAEKGASGQVYRTRQPFITESYAACPIRLDGLSGAECLGPTIIVPLQSESQFTGVIMASRIQGLGVEPFTAESVRLLAAISDMVGIALRRLTLYEEAQRRLSEVQALREIDVTIIGSLDLQLNLTTILEKVRQRLGVDAASFLLLNPYRLTLEFAHGSGFRTSAIEDVSLHMGEGYAGRSAKERRTVHIVDLRADGGNFFHPIDEEVFVEYYAVPLVAKGQVKGVLEVFNRSPIEADQEWVEFLETLAGQSAIAIENAGLYMDLQHSNEELVLAYDATIEGWSRALDLRDKETEGHTQRVTEMTFRLAQAMGVLEAELVHIRRGALLHDIGKMGIPDGILLKPGPLTEEEWVVMRKHPFYAYQMLAPIVYLRPALDIPYCHHEKWDGTGYPRGLRGEEIPLAARAFAVIDVWDALTSNRPYRPAWSEEKAMEFILSEVGKHFDPQMVEEFFKLIKRS